MKKVCLLTAVVLGVACMESPAQTPSPTPNFAVNCVKVKPGKSGEFQKWTQDTLHKYAQARVDSGALEAWVLLRAVQPTGTANECDYYAAGFYPGNPSKPLETEELDALLKKSGAGMSVDQYRERLNELSELVSSGFWRQMAAAGSPSHKSDYVLINYNKAIDVDKWVAMEKKIWMPFAQELTKEGITRGWEVDLRTMPSGTGLKYDGVTLDVFPSWDAYINFPTNPKLDDLWKKVHPDQTYEQMFPEYAKVTNLILRELWVVQDVVVAQK